MGFVAILGGLVAVGLGGHLAARSAFRLPRGVPEGLGAFLLGWIWLSLGTLGLGSIGLLARGPLIAWSAVGLGAGLVAARRWPATAEKVAAGAPEGWGTAAAIALGLAGWAVIVMLVPSLILPVKVASDGPIYHLLFAIRWWQAGRIVLVPTPFGETAAPYFPAFGDLWLTWLVVMGGGDRVARVGQVPFLVAAAVAVYALARRAGASPSSSAVATAWFATISPLLVYATEPIVDLIFYVGYLLAIYFAARWVQGDGGRGSLVLAGLAAGGAWGTKAPGVVFIPPLLAGLVVLTQVRAAPIRERLRDAAVVALTPFVAEGYWLARNAWLTGNPLYPLHLTAFGRVVLAGWYGPGAMSTSQYYIGPTEWRLLADILLSVLDARLIPLWLAALVGAWRLGRPRAQGDRLAWACAGLATVNFALFWLCIPYRTQLRFFLHATALAAVPLARLFDRGRWLRGLGVALLAVHATTPQDWPFTSLLARIPWDFSSEVPSSAPSSIPLLDDLDTLVHPTAVIGVGGSAALIAEGGLCLVAGGLCAWACRGARGRWAAPTAALVLAGLIQAAVIVTHQTDPIYFRFPYFPDYLFGWADLESRLGRSPARVAYAGTNLPYYLMGPDLGREVRYINVDEHRGWLLHDYHRDVRARGPAGTWPDTRPGWDRLRPDYDAWLANLDAARVQVLVVTRSNGNEGRFNRFDREGFPIERAWADAHPERFVLLYADPLFRTYALRPPVLR